MRVTTGLLLTAALLIPGAARAQFGGPGSPRPTALPGHAVEVPIREYQPPPTLPPHFSEEQSELYAKREVESLKFYGEVGLAGLVILSLAIKAVCPRGGGKDDPAR